MRVLIVAPALAIALITTKFTGIFGGIVLLATLVFIHELGHFLVARHLRLPVATFSLGFGPRLVGFKWRETDMRLSAIPIGGYVKLQGFNPETPLEEDPHGFNRRSYGAKMLFYAGGVLMNLLTALVLMWVVSADRVRATPHPQASPLLIESVKEGRPAFQSGLRPGDLILKLGDLNFPEGSTEDARRFLEANPGKSIPITFVRQAKIHEASVVPVQEAGAGRIGVTFRPSVIHLERRPMTLGDVGRGIQIGTATTWRMTREVAIGFARLLSFQVKAGEISGPISIAKAGGQAANTGWEHYLLLCAFVSVNLAILNSLPLPFLDGGHMAILTLERIRRRELPAKLKESVMTAGSLLLVGLSAVVIFLDVLNLKR